MTSLLTSEVMSVLPGVGVTRRWVRPAVAAGAVFALLFAGLLVFAYARATAPPSAREVASARCVADGNVYVTTDRGSTCLQLGNLGRLALGLAGK